MKKTLSRRRVLRGMLNGTAVTIGLPLLNCFLNDNGTAWASGAKMPVRFGTWAWGLGMNKAIFVPQKIGTGFDLPEEIASLANVRDHINLLTNATYFRDSYQNLCHFTGWVVSRTGAAPKAAGFIPGETIDVTIANQIGNATRFKSLTATAAGDVRGTYSYENTNTPNAQEWSPIQFYTRLFGPEFQDPNAPEFKPAAPGEARADRCLRASQDSGLRCTHGLGSRIGAASPSHDDGPAGHGAGLRSDPRVQHGLLPGPVEHHQARLRKAAPHDDPRGTQ